MCERCVNLLVYSLSLHRHSYIGFILAFSSSIHNSIHNKQTLPLVFHHTDPHIQVFYLALFFLCDLLSFKIYMVQPTRLYNLLWRTWVKSRAIRGPESRPCHTEMISPVTVRSSVLTTPYPHLRQCSDRRPPHPHQFVISCPMYLCPYVPIYIRSIEFAYFVSFSYQKWHFYIPEHYIHVVTSAKPPLQRLFI